MSQKVPINILQARAAVQLHGSQVKAAKALGISEGGLSTALRRDVERNRSKYSDPLLFNLIKAYPKEARRLQRKLNA